MSSDSHNQGPNTPGAPAPAGGRNVAADPNRPHLNLDHLNPEQRDAVLTTEGPLLVFAGAGSGKTRVITHRIAHLVLSGKAPLSKILAVTFTNKAAEEMRRRTGELLGANPFDGSFGERGFSFRFPCGTFHAIAARILRNFGSMIGIDRNFVIYDDSDQKSVLNRIIKDRNIDEKKISARFVASILDRMKNEMRTPEALHEVTEGEVLAIIQEYETRLARAQALDFGDLIYRLVRGLEHNPNFRRHIASRFDYLLVDEFQDTNIAQLRLLQSLTLDHQNLCVVGDDDQSIYRWRGAEPRNILDFRKHYPGAHVVKLETNYRSTARILRAAQSIIEKNLEREPKTLTATRHEGPPILIVKHATERDEAQLVAQTVLDALDHGLTRSDIAVFYRVHAQSRVVEESLRAANIPYRIVGGVRFYDRAEVKDLLAYLRLLSNSEDDVSFLRIVNQPPRGIGKTTLDRILDRAANDGVSVEQGARAFLVQKGGDKVGVFLTLIDRLRDSLQQETPLSELAQEVLELSGYQKALEREESEDAENRLGVLAELIGAMREYEVSTEEPSLSDFLERVALTSDSEKGVPQDSVTLMTVHAAKGLEFHTVLVIGMEEQLFPLRTEDGMSSLEEMEEERRLAYVAMTRARERLLLNWAEVRYVFGRARFGFPSRYLGEISPGDAQWVGHTTPPRWQRERMVRETDPYQSEDWQSDRWQNHAGDSGDEGGSPRLTDEVSASSRWPSRSVSVAPRGGGLASKPAPRKAAKLEVGSAVRHLRYGVGTIHRVDQGAVLLVTVVFDRFGEKQIAANYLERVE